MPPKQQKPITIKQFEWYEVQTKVREIMSDLLQPFNKKQTQEAIKINEIKRNLNIVSKRLDDHDFLLDRQQATKPTYLQLQDQKIEQLKDKFLEHQSQNNTKIKAMEVVIEVYEQKINQLNTLQKKLDCQIQERIDNLKKYRDNIDQSINLMLKKLQTQQDDNNLLKNSTRNSLQKLQLKLVGCQNRIKDNEDEIKRKGQDLKRLLQDSISHNEKLIRSQLKQVEIIAKMQQRQKDAKLSQKFFTKVKEVQNDLLFLHKYLESYLPLYTQMQISDSLNIIVKGKQRRQLCLYEEKKFAKYHHHILEDDANTLQELMSAYSTNIRKIINRNRKYIIDLKVQQSIKYGLNVYEIRVEEDMLYDDQNDQNKKTVNMIVPHEQIERVLNEKWESMAKQIERDVKSTIQPTNEWIKELEEQCFKRFSSIQIKQQHIVSDNKKLAVSLELQQKHTLNQIATIKEERKDERDKFDIYKDYIKDILNFNSVLNHIIIQDQIDRQGTALYALKGKQTNIQKSNPTIQLDPNCVNCNRDGKSSQLIQQAFKMACLTYNPSQIKIDEEYFSRQQILQISTNILQRLKKKMDQNNQRLTNLTSSPQQINSGVKANKKESIILAKPKQIQDYSNNTIHQTHRRKTFSNTKQSNQRSASNSSRISNKNISPGIGVVDRQKDKNYQTLLPALSSSTKKRIGQKERNTHLSVFY